MGCKRGLVIKGQLPGFTLFHVPAEFNTGFKPLDALDNRLCLNRRTAHVYPPLRSRSLKGKFNSKTAGIRYGKGIIPYTGFSIVAVGL